MDNTDIFYSASQRTFHSSLVFAFGPSLFLCRLVPYNVPWIYVSFILLHSQACSFWTPSIRAKCLTHGFFKAVPFLLKTSLYPYECRSSRTSQFGSNLTLNYLLDIPLIWFFLPLSTVSESLSKPDALRASFWQNIGVPPHPSTVIPMYLTRKFVYQQIFPNSVHLSHHSSTPVIGINPQKGAYFISATIETFLNSSAALYSPNTPPMQGF